MPLALDAAGSTPRAGPQDARLRLARTCYDRMAGCLGVSLADALMPRGWVEIANAAALATLEGKLEQLRCGLTALGNRRIRRRDAVVQTARPVLDRGRVGLLLGRDGEGTRRRDLARGLYR